MNEHMQRYNNVDEKRPVEKKMNLQTISTDLAKAFNGPKGAQVNRQCAAQFEEWARLGLDKTRAVRLRISLPGFDESNIILTLATCIRLVALFSSGTDVLKHAGTFEITS